MLICQVSDLHMCAPGRLAYGAVDTNALSHRALAAVGAFRPAPAALLVTGDLANEGADAEYAAFRAAVTRHVSLPVYVIPGNHDATDALRRVLAGWPGLDDGGRFIHYTIDDLPVRIVMLDTHVPGENYGLLCPERLAFLEAALSTGPERPTLIAMHHPPFACGIGFMDRDNLRNAPEFADIVGRHRQVRQIVCGHVHRAVFGQCAGVPTMIAPSPCHNVALELAPDAPGGYVLDPPAFVIHRWSPEGDFASHMAFVGPVPGPFPFSG